MEQVSFELLVNQLVQAGLALAFFALAYFAKTGVKIAAAYLEEKAGTDKFLMLKELAVTIVRSLQQTEAFKDLDGSEKKQKALVFLYNQASALGIEIDTELLSHMIEEAVQMMKAELGSDELISEFLGEG
jgi:hypothetical protein